MRFPRFASAPLALFTALGLAGCTEVMVTSHVVKKATNYNTCRPEGDLKVGNPYLVDGIQYKPVPSSLNYKEQGIASWYGPNFHGKSTANGECYDQYAYTAAHKTLPLPTIVRVTNLENNKSIVLKVNDRGPFVGTRVIDLSYAAAQALDVARKGTAPVVVEAIGGPHNYPNGLKDYLALNKPAYNIPLGPGGPGGNRPAAALAAVNQPAVQSEALEPLGKPNGALTAQLANVPPTNSFTERAVANAREAALANSSPVQPPVDANPASLPPEPQNPPVADTSPLRNTRVFVQTGAYSEKGRAETELGQLKSSYPNAALTPLNRPGGRTLWRVRTGPYTSLADAESALARMQDQGFNQAQVKVEKD